MQSSSAHDVLLLLVYANVAACISGETKFGCMLAQESRVGVLTYLAERGCATLMGRFFNQKSSNMGHVFLAKNP